MSRIFCCFITAWMLGTAEASDDPIEPRAAQTQTTLSGAWSGKAKVVAYPPTNLGALPIAIKIPTAIGGGATREWEF